MAPLVIGSTAWMFEGRRSPTDELVVRRPPGYRE